uniref:Uncharacterized protein n=1 Tax=Photinus pyralis TaxID=7054 RepID=A0A1Y1N1H4_PHOPY
MSYSVVEFSDGVQVVPTSWIFKECNIDMCWWPPNCNDKFQINRLVSGNHNPESNWKKHKLLKIFCQTPTYEKGKEKLEYALLLSDVEVEDDAVKRSRHQRHCSKRDAACVDTDEAHSKSNKKKIKSHL